MVFKTLKEAYGRAKELNERAANSGRLYKVHELLDALMPLILIVLFVVLYLEFFVNLNHFQHELVLIAQRVILVYFILEIFFEFLVYEDNRKFFRHKWFDILLVLPFLSVMKGLRGLKFLKLGKSAKAGKAAKGGKAVKGAKIAKHGKKAQHVTKFFKKSWEKFLKSLKD